MTRASAALYLISIYLISIKLACSSPSPSGTEMEGVRVAIVGGSIGGLAAATALIRLGATVRVFEKSAGAYTG